MRRLAPLVVVTATACPPWSQPLEQTSAPATDGSSSSGPSTPTSGGDDGAPATTRESSGASSTTGESTGESTGDPPEAWCEAFDPTRVYIQGRRGPFGVWHEQRDGVARPDDPADSCVGFGFIPDYYTRPFDFAVRPTDGRMLYIQLPSLRIFGEDPAAQTDNDDEILPTDRCGPDGVNSFLIRPVDGSFIYACTFEDPWRYYDGQSGEVVLTEYQGAPLAIAHDGTFLTVNGPLMVVRDSAGPVPVTPAAAANADAFLTARAHTDGFWIALRPALDAPVERWYVAAMDGAASFEGTFADTPGAPVPPYAFTGSDEVALTGEGDLIFVRITDENEPVLMLAGFGADDLVQLSSTTDIPAADQATFIHTHVVFTGP